MWYILKIKFHIGIAMIVMRHFSLPWLASHMYKQGSFPMTYFRERDYSLNWSAMAKDWGNQLYCRTYILLVFIRLCNTSWPTLAILFHQICFNHQPLYITRESLCNLYSPVLFSREPANAQYDNMKVLWCDNIDGTCEIFLLITPDLNSFDLIFHRLLLLASRYCWPWWWPFKPSHSSVLVMTLTTLFLYPSMCGGHKTNCIVGPLSI